MPLLLLRSGGGWGGVDGLGELATRTEPEVLQVKAKNGGPVCGDPDSNTHVEG